LRFSDIKLFYELIEELRVSDGAVRDLLKRLLKKGILRRVESLCYLTVDPESAETIMDLKRVRNCLKEARTYLNQNSSWVFYKHSVSRDSPGLVEKF